MPDIPPTPPAPAASEHPAPRDAACVEGRGLATAKGEGIGDARTDAAHIDMAQAGPSGAAVIVIPSYDRPEQLRLCLDHLSRLDGGPWQVIVVDDGSPEPLAPVCADFPGVRCVRRENGGPGAARNTGAAAAGEARWLLFTDDDCRPRPDWALRMLQAQGGVPMRLVGGRIENMLCNVFSQASQSLSSYLYAYYQSRGSQMSFFTTNNMCCRTADFAAVGGFDPKFRIASEDRDLSLRWKDAGGALSHVPGAVVDHAHRLTLASYWRQHANYGHGARTLHLALDGRGDDRPKVEPFGFYLGLLLWPLRHSSRLRLVESGLIGLSQVAMVWGYWRAKRAGRRG
ncbi:glycosyltransferase family 2 protein [Profundibacterium mesophilum]|uniref:Dolichol-phosphate mannosyltransferase n=1 Tax=Profundibacterium mesophilum KAUST100406-0324 TaxID=1037889 RepID=A0A921NUS4_9RHOB|nr:glycosyltransferase [Profundibacterium mesophilum]KAF0675880.1 dolichol-phosphate mannosyltransferase [Profundibacterium mesophilum KAUST100406-0324]